MNLADEQLMAQVVAGDSAALETLYDRYAASLMGVVLRIVKERTVAEEIVQETFWRVWDKADSFAADRGKFSTWMQQAVDDAEESGLTGERMAWYQFQLGELYFNSGDVAAAQAQYASAKQTWPDYYLVLVGEGKVAAAQGDFEQAIDHYERLVARLPQPDFVAALGDFYLLAENETAAQQQYDTVSFIANLETIDQASVGRQLALFYANHDINLDSALAAAEAEFAGRPDVYGYDVLAWTLFKNGRLDEAATASEQALKLGTPEALFYYHAGMIAAAQGNSSQAKQHLSYALELNPHFDFLQAQIAQETLQSLP